MTNEEAIGFLQSRIDLIDKCYPDVKDYREALIVAIKSLERDNGVLERVEDCINRAWLKEAIHNFYYGLKHTPTEEDIQAYIDVAPPVTPQPRMGRWMHPYKSDIACECSECHIQMPITKSFNYCPNCGAKMEVQNADSD